MLTVLTGKQIPWFEWLPVGGNWPVECVKQQGNGIFNRDLTNWFGRQTIKGNSPSQSLTMSIQQVDGLFISLLLTWLLLCLIRRAMG
jgi:hypothetical protein